MRFLVYHFVIKNGMEARRSSYSKNWWITNINMKYFLVYNSNIVATTTTINTTTSTVVATVVLVYTAGQPDDSRKKFPEMTVVQ